jgi:hypothetical protein
MSPGSGDHGEQELQCSAAAIGNFWKKSVHDAEEQVPDVFLSVKKGVSGHYAPSEATRSTCGENPWPSSFPGGWL